jgi:hypothetical protein
VGAVVVTKDEPHDGVQDVVQSQRDQEPVERAVHAAAHHGVVRNGVSDGRQSGVEVRVDQGQEHADHNRGEGRQDGHQPAAGEKAQPVRQGGAGEALPEQRRRQAHHDTGQHAVVDDRILATLRSGAQYQRRHHLEDVGQDQISDDGGEGRGAVALLGKTEGDADGEEQRQVLEQGAACGADDLGDGGQGFEPAQQVVLAKAKQ